MREPVALWIQAGVDGWPAWPPTSPSIQESVVESLKSGDWRAYHSRSVDELATAIASMHSHDGSDPRVRLCSSGSVAIELALRAIGIGNSTPRASKSSEKQMRSDCVVVAAFDFPGNFRTIELLGAKPVLVDVKAGGVTMDPESLREVEHPDVRAVIASHLFGHLADMPRIAEICRQRGWLLIEDACQSPGAGWRCVTEEKSGRADTAPVGTYSDVATLSFGGSKPLSAGNGGALLTRNDRIASKVDQLMDRPSNVYPLSALQATVVLPQLTMLDSLNECRVRGAEAVRGMKWCDQGAKPISPPSLDTLPCYYKLAIELESQIDRDAWLADFVRQDFLGKPQPPIGASFRSMDSTSDRRSLKPVALTRSAILSTHLVVLDHRVLLHFGHDPKNS